MRTIETIDDLAQVIDLDAKPPGWRTVMMIDLAMNGPMSRTTALRLAHGAECRTVDRSAPPTAPDNWSDHAACKGLTAEFSYDTYQAQNGYKMSQRDKNMERVALAICHECPVMIQCREWALQPNDPAVDMVAGGMTPRQRWQWRRQHR